MGPPLGRKVGLPDGSLEGQLVGRRDGRPVGRLDGWFVGPSVG